MDPLTALSVTCNALQIFDVAWKLFSGARDIYLSPDGMSLRIKTFDAIANNVTKLSGSIAAQSNLTPELQELSQLSENVASDLSAILNKLKARRPQSKWQSFRVALKEISASGQIKEFSHRIRQLQTQAMANIQFLIMARFQNDVDQLRLDVVDRLSQIRIVDVEAKMDGVLKELEQLTLKQPTGIEAISIKLNELADSISRLQQDMETTKSHHDVLQAIRFDRLSFRFDRISVAYSKTFDWAFEDQAPGARGLVSLRFRDWLLNQQGIFWIRGKAGCGKSTLMKFLCKDERTFAELNEWAGDARKLVVAKYFFWNPGAPLQKSQEDLMRSLLFDILSQCPEHIPRVQTRLTRRRTDVKDGEEIWTWEMLWGAFNEIVSENTTAKMCLFIDGLDEFEGDSETLIDTMRALASCPAVKVCVSSRPWAEFVHEFRIHDTRLLRVEDLTAQDIREYVHGTLFGSSRFRRLITNDGTVSQLLEEIVSKSDGVFLWVRLVVQSLLQGLKYADSKYFLWKRLRSFPPDLNDVFLHMLKSIPDIYRAKAVSTFKAAMVASPPLPAMDDNFALEHGWKAMPHDEILSNMEDMALRLDGWTKGLLEVKVEFLHRTVRDFIEESDYVRQLFGRLRYPQLNVSGMICHSSLAFLKCDPNLNSSHIDYDFLMSIFNHAALVADDDWRIKRIQPVLDDVGRAMMEAGREWKGTPTTRTMCQYAAEYGLKDYIRVMLQIWDLMQDCAGWKGCRMRKFHTDLLRIALRSKRTSTLHDRPWASISGTVTYLLEKGANPSQLYGENTIWWYFLNDFSDRIPLGDKIVLELLRTLIAAGADLDVPFGKSKSRTEIRHILPQEQATMLLAASKPRIQAII
ncbi:hypothetical protein F4677DRAFT_455720 [Hypoxylon crocopeplum]|nr:hypothetical protein F4677DRAFT_455720 [Hypoxylon crocopeplum]